MNSIATSCQIITRPRNKYGVKAFTLLEMSIVIAIIAVILGGGMVIFASSLQKKQLEETNAKLAAIQAALLDYRRAFNRIPCPGNLTTYNVSDAYFGTEYSGTFDGRCLGTPGASYSHLISGTACTNAGQHCVFGGAVPTKTLRLPDDYAFDGWGRRILYAVDGQFTITNAFLNGTTTSSITYDTTPANSVTRIQIAYATTPSYKTQIAGYALVSFGPNGHGAYGRLASNRITSGSARVEELENCDCTASAAAGTFNNTFYQMSYQPDAADPQNVFDDIVVYATRADLRSSAE